MRVTDAFYKVIKSMEAMGVVALLFTMMITFSDVVMGMFRRPIHGAYDLAGIGSGIAISFSIAITSWKKQHIMVDTIYLKFPARLRTFWGFMLRMINGATFALVSVYLFMMVADFKRTGEVCGTLSILPLWPIALLLGCACVVQCLVSVTNVMNTIRGEHKDE